jgi:hypothetical protein
MATIVSQVLILGTHSIDDRLSSQTRYVEGTRHTHCRRSDVKSARSEGSFPIVSPIGRNTKLSTIAKCQEIDYLLHRKASAARRGHSPLLAHWSGIEGKAESGSLRPQRRM